MVLNQLKALQRKTQGPLEFLLLCDGLMASAASRHGFDPPAWHSGLKDPVFFSCSSDLIPGRGTPLGFGSQKSQKQNTRTWKKKLMVLEEEESLSMNCSVSAGPVDFRGPNQPSQLSKPIPWQ